MKPWKSLRLKCVQLSALILLTVTTASAQLHADFGANITAGCTPLVVNFQDKSTGSPTEWKWDLGNNTTVTQQHPSAVYITPGTYTVKLVVKNTAGKDSVTKQQFITVYAEPNVDFTVLPATGCYPLKVQFTDLTNIPAGNTATWQWDFGDGNLSNAQNPTHTYITQGSFDVKLKVATDKGCIKAIAKNNLININGGVTAGFTSSAPGTCQAPTPVTFTNTSTGTGTLSYQWFFGDGGTSIDANPVHSYTTAGNYTVKLIVTNNFGCTDTLIKTNTINIGFVKANFTHTNNICADKNVTVTNTSTPVANTATWYFSDGTSLTGNTVTKAFSAAGTYDIKLVSDFGACKDSVTKSVTILPKPTAAFDVVGNVTCQVPATVQFTSTATNAVAYKWYFGDGGNATGATTSHTYTVKGAYGVSLVVTGANGCTDSLSKAGLIQLQPPSIGGLQFSPKEGCVPLPVQMNSTITATEPIAQYSWSFGDGNTDATPNPLYTYTTEGIFDVKLVIVTASGCKDSMTVKKAVRVGHKPVVDFSASPLDVCAYKSSTFTDLSTNGPVDQWFWWFSDGGSATVQNPSHLFKDTGMITVKLIVWNNGCQDSLTKSNYIHVAPPIAKFDVVNDCVNRLNIAFQNKSVGATIYNWSFGDGTFSNEESPVHTFPKTGIYTVTLKVTNGSCEHETTKVVYVADQPAQMQLSATEVCRKSEMKLIVTGPPNVHVDSYKWTTGVGNEISVKDSVFKYTYQQAGTYPVSVKVFYKNYCKDTLTLSGVVNVYGPVAAYTPASVSNCSEVAVNFNDASTTDGIHNITQWQWNYGDGNTVQYTAPPFQHTYTVGGNKNVSLKVTDSYGCTDSINKVNAVNIAKVTAKFKESDTLICPDAIINFTNQSTPGSLSYQWSFSDGFTATTANVAHAFSTQGVYSVKLLAYDANGCKDSVTKVNRLQIARPKAAFALSDTFASCPPLLVDCINQSQYAVSNSWTFGINAGGASTLVSPSNLYTYPGTYQVKLKVTGNGGCTDSTTAKVRILGPTGTLSYLPLIGCSPLKVNFTANSQNTVKHIWDYNNGVVIESATATNSYTYTTMGAYLPKVILEDAAGCKVPLIGKDSIKVKDIDAHIKFVANTVCDSATIAFQDSSSTNDKITAYQWTFGDGGVASIANPAHNFNKAGLFTVKLVVTTQAGCKDSASLVKTIKVVPAPIVGITGGTEVCLNGSLSFAGTISNPDTSAINWFWSLPGGTTATVKAPPAQIFTTAGLTDVKVIATNSSGCADTLTKQITVYALPVVDAGLDTFVCRGKAIQLQPSGAVTYSWSGTGLSCINCPGPSVSPTGDALYKVVGKDAHSCQASDSVWVKVQQHLPMKIDKHDTLCLGQSTTKTLSGTERYSWWPALYVNNPNAAQVIITPAKDTLMTYRVIGQDNRGCFADTGYIKIKTFPIPKMEPLQSEITVNAGTSFKLESSISKDVTKVKWSPAKWLDNPDSKKPTAIARESITYTVVASNDGQCVTRNEVKITVLCNGANFFIPNTFSPNSDGMNDLFYPRGKGVFTIKSFRIFNRWGEIVFERMHFNPNDQNAGWDGTYKGQKLPSDVYMYAIEVQCDNSTIVPAKGNVTLLR